MRRPLIVQLAGVAQVSPSEVGGKAASLIRMIDAGFPVPSGAVLTTTFFAPWFDSVKTSAPWHRLTRAAPEEWAPLCDALKEHARSLPLTATQRDALETLIGDLAARGDEVRFAVRSSSPDEDLTSSSYAGLYDTRLGVRPGDMEEAVRGCFVSSLDVRVFTYKEARGFDTWSPRLAVVVQHQLDSDVAGVAFSLNPVTNDYDELVIDANWGLGTSVVEGRVSPDHFVVDKVEGRVVEETLGAKRVSVWLDADGSTFGREGHRSAERTLTDEQLHELTVVISRIEDLYETPVDVEWAYTDGKLHVLQARPITAWVPLPPEMVTRPGERRRLYADGALSKGMTINAPISPLGLDHMKSMFSVMLESWVGPLNRDVAPEDALFFFAGGRMYVNYSNIMWLASPEKLARSASPTDALMAQILAGVDATRYRAARRPPWVSFRLLWLAPRVLWSVRRFFWNVQLAMLAPERANRKYRQRCARSSASKAAGSYNLRRIAVATTK